MLNSDRQGKARRGIFLFRDRLIAIFLSVCLTLSGSVSYATPSLRASTISIPLDLGRIEESYLAPRSTNHDPQPTIIYIQDAHDSLEAQENIAKLIHYLVEHYGVKTVFEEGYEGPVPTDEYFGFIKDPEIKEKVSYFLMDKLRIGGAEYAHINRKKDFRLIGADSIKLHLENIRWYRESEKHREETAKDLTALSREIDKLAHRYFPKELKEWMKLRKRYDENQISLLDYLRWILSLRGGNQGQIQKAKNGLVPSNDIAYPIIELLLAAENTQDKEMLEKVKSIEPKALFEEIDRMENDFVNQFFHTKRDQQIFHYHKALTLLKRLNEIQITPAEYEVLKDDLQNLNTQELAEFIVRQTKKSIVLSRKWEEHIQKAVSFYETSRARDGAIEKALTREADLVKREAQEDSRNTLHSSRFTPPAVLVFGGFHKERIKEILQKRGYSFLVVSPKMTQIDSKHQSYYKRLMSVGHHPFEPPFNITRAAKTQPVYSMPNGRAEVQAVYEGVRRLGDQPLPILLSGLEKELLGIMKALSRTSHPQSESIRQARNLVPSPSTTLGVVSPSNHKVEGRVERAEVRRSELGEHRLSEEELNLLMEADEERGFMWRNPESLISWLAFSGEPWTMQDGRKMVIKKGAPYRTGKITAHGFDVFIQDEEGHLSQKVLYLVFDSGVVYQFTTDLPEADRLAALGVSHNVFNLIATDLAERNMPMVLDQVINPKMLTLFEKVGTNVEIQFNFQDARRILGDKSEREIEVFDKYGMTSSTVILSKDQSGNFHLSPDRLREGTKDALSLKMTKDGKISLERDEPIWDVNIPGEHVRYWISVDENNSELPYLKHYLHVHPLTGKRFYKIVEGVDFFSTLGETFEVYHDGKKLHFRGEDESGNLLIPDKYLISFNERGFVEVKNWDGTPSDRQLLYRDYREWLTYRATPRPIENAIQANRELLNKFREAQKERKRILEEQAAQRKVKEKAEAEERTKRVLEPAPRIEEVPPAAIVRSVDELIQWLEKSFFTDETKRIDRLEWGYRVSTTQFAPEEKSEILEWAEKVIRTNQGNDFQAYGVDETFPMRVDIIEQKDLFNPGQFITTLKLSRSTKRAEVREANLRSEDELKPLRIAFLGLEEKANEDVARLLDHTGRSVEVIPKGESYKAVFDRHQVIVVTTQLVEGLDYQTYKKDYFDLATQLGKALQTLREEESKEGKQGERKVIILRDHLAVQSSEDFYWTMLRELNWSENANFDVVYQPNFAQRTETGKLEEPVVVFGVRDSKPEERELTFRILRHLYPSKPQLKFINIRSTELAYESYLMLIAVKLSHFRSLTPLAERILGDSYLMALGAGMDHRIGFRHINPSLAYGGQLTLLLDWIREERLVRIRSRIPDIETKLQAAVRALEQKENFFSILDGLSTDPEIASSVHVLFLLEVMRTINQRNLDHAIAKIKNVLGEKSSYPKKKVAILGIGYSERESQITNSPVLKVIERLFEEGIRRFRISDPPSLKAFRAWIKEKRRTNVRYNSVQFKGAEKRDQPLGLYAAVREADLTIIAQESHVGLRQLDLSRFGKALRGSPLFDGIGLFGRRANGEERYTFEAARRHGIHLIPLGRPPLSKLVDSKLYRSVDDLKGIGVQVASKRVTVIGAGYVGLVTAANLASLGHDVTVYDVDQSKIEKLSKAPDQIDSPILEKGLEPLLRQVAGEGRFHATGKLDEALSQAELIFVAVPTPQQDSGEIDLKYIEQVARDVVAHFKRQDLEKPIPYVIKSTVTNEAFELTKRIFREGGLLNVIGVSNPEFLREGHAMKDVSKPHRTMIGIPYDLDSSLRSDLEKTLLELFYPLMEKHEHPILVTNPETSTLTKYASNAFLAISISLATVLAYEAEANSADFKEIEGVLRLLDPIGEYAFIAPGCWGGSCFPKDVRALDTYSTKEEGAKHSLLSIRYADGMNDRHKAAVFDSVKRILRHHSRTPKGGTLAFLGMTFKPDTDDTRETPSAIAVVQALRGGVAQVRIHDPVQDEPEAPPIEKVRASYLDEVYKVGKSFPDFVEAFDTLKEKIVFVDSVEQLVPADVMVLTTDWKVYRTIDFKKLKGLSGERLIGVVDGRNIWHERALKGEFVQLGMDYMGVGMPAIFADMVSAQSSDASRAEVRELKMQEAEKQRGKETKRSETRRDVPQAVNRFQEKYAVVVDMNVFDALSEEQQIEFKKLIHARPEVKFVFHVMGERKLDSVLQDLMDFKGRYKNVEIRIDPTRFDFQGRKIISISKEGVRADYTDLIEKKLGQSKDLYRVRYQENDKNAGLLTAALLLLESKPEDFMRQGRYFSEVQAGFRAQIRQFLLTYVYVARSA